MLLIFYFVMPGDFNLLEGARNIVLILGMTAFLKSAPSFILAVSNSPFYKEKEKDNKLLITVMKLLKSMMFGLFVVNVLMTIFAVIGMYASNVLVNIAHMFALTIPMWLTVREGIVNLVDSFNQQTL